MAEARLSFSSFKKQLDDQLTCSVCLDQYTNPKTLPCLHSFCLKCIQQLPVEIKHGKYYISCPTCRVHHLIPEGGAINFPNDFKINSLLDLQKKIPKTTHQKTTPSTIHCPKHSDPLKVYCETCCQVVCCECTLSEEHNTHNFHLISKCYPKHHQQLQESLDLVIHKTADIDAVIAKLAIKEREVLQQGQQLKEEINTHAQQIIDQVQKSHTHLSQQVDTIVQQKTKVLIAQRQQAQKLHTQLENCQEMIEHSLKEWTKQQILTEKHTMMDQMSTATQHVDPAVLQPREKADIQFVKTDIMEKEIGLIATAPSGKQSSAATLTLQSHEDPSPLSTFSSQKKSNIIPTDRDRLSLPVGITLPVIPRAKPVNTITGLFGPWGITVRENGDIVVVEKNGHCITIMDKVEMKMKALGPNKKTKFTYPHGVAITKNGHILVTDNHRLQKLTAKGACVKSVGSKNIGHDQLHLNYPQGIVVHSTTGQIFVADGWNHRIQVYNNNLALLHTIILPHDIKQFKWPCDVKLDNEGYLYVAECDGHCITKLTTTGQYITRFGSEGSAPGQLLGPSSLAISNSLVYVSERENNRVSIFDTTGKFLHCFGKKGSREGEFHDPCGIAIDILNHKLYVSDTRNDRVLVYQLNS